MSSLLDYALSFNYKALIDYFVPGLTEKYYDKPPEALISTKVPNIMSVVEDSRKTGFLKALKSNTVPETLLHLNNGEKEIMCLDLNQIDSLSGINSVDEFQVKYNLESFQALSGSLLAGTINKNLLLLEDVKRLMKTAVPRENMRTISRATLKSGLAPLHLSLALHSDLSVFNKLIEISACKSFINSRKNKFGLTVLSIAALRNLPVSVIEALTKNGADVFLVDNSRKNILFDFVFSAQDEQTVIEIFKYLTQKLSKEELIRMLFQKGNDGYSFLDILCTLPMPHLFELVQKNTEEARNSLVFRKTLIFRACDAGNLDATKSLLKEDALLISAKDTNSLSLLHYAAYDGNTEMVKELLEHGANLTDVSRENISSLYYAVSSGNLSCIKLLVSKYQSMYEEQEANSAVRREIEFIFLSSLVEALRKQKEIVANYLTIQTFQFGVSCTAALDFALKNSTTTSPDTLDLLFTTLDDVSSHTIDGDNILIFAAKNCNLELIISLLKNHRFDKSITEDASVREFMNSVEITDDMPLVVQNMVTKCVVCLEANCTTRFMPCEHIQCCKLCAHKLVRADKRCPTCRKEIQNVLEI